MKKEDLEQQPKNLPGGGKAIIDWCRPLWLDGADARRPLRLEVTAQVRDPDATQMPHDDELTELDNLAFRIGKALPGGAGTEHAMTITGAGERTWIYYMKPRVGVVRKQDPRTVVPGALERLRDPTGAPLRLAWEDDPAWSKLLGIFEAHDPAQWREDRALMVHMIKANDAVHGRRVVGHRASFAEREQCRDFLRDVRRLKFKPDGGPKPTADGRLTTLVERIEPSIVTWHLHPVVLSVKALVLEHGGTYDGWETPLIPSLTPPPLTGPRPG